MIPIPQPPLLRLPRSRLTPLTFLPTDIRSVTDRRVTIRVVASEVVVPRGTARTTWLIYTDGQWRSVRDVSDVVLTQLDPKPGIVWHTEAALTVPAGTWLQRTQRDPNEATYRDPLRYLENEVRRARERVRRDYFRVAPSGKLTRDRTPPPTDVDNPTGDEG
jgi:hypothetical protein